MDVQGTGESSKFQSDLSHFNNFCSPLSLLSKMGSFVSTPNFCHHKIYWKSPHIFTKNSQKCPEKWAPKIQNIFRTPRWLQSVSQTVCQSSRSENEKKQVQTTFFHSIFRHFPSKKFPIFLIFPHKNAFKCHKTLCTCKWDKTTQFTNSQGFCRFSRGFWILFWGCAFIRLESNW